MENWYSSPILRISTSKLKNPKYFNHVSVLGDGNNNRVDYANKKDVSNLRNNQFISFKLKRTSCGTQIFLDTNVLPICVTETTPNIVDGYMLRDYSLYKIINKNECAGLDGG